LIKAAITFRDQLILVLLYPVYFIACCRSYLQGWSTNDDTRRTKSLLARVNQTHIVDANLTDFHATTTELSFAVLVFPFVYWNIETTWTQLRTRLTWKRENAAEDICTDRHGGRGWKVGISIVWATV